MYLLFHAEFSARVSVLIVVIEHVPLNWPPLAPKNVYSRLEFSIVNRMFLIIPPRNCLPHKDPQYQGYPSITAYTRCVGVWVPGPMDLFSA